MLVDLDRVKWLTGPVDACPTPKNRRNWRRTYRERHPFVRASSRQAVPLPAASSDAPLSKDTPMRIQFWSLPALALVLSACGSDATPPAEAPPSSSEPPASSSEKPGDDPTQSDINIDDKIKKACGLSDTEAHFAYNSSSVRAADQAVIKKLADCFATGPLKGKTMGLVGHADPRGEPEYNMVLGGKRADNVAKALSKAGLSNSQISTTSRGELDATGSDEASWSKDRSVDVHLVE